MVPSRESRGKGQQRPSLENMPSPISISSSQNGRVSPSDMEDGSDEDLDCYESISVPKPHLRDCTFGKENHRNCCVLICLCSCWACSYYRYEKDCLNDKMSKLLEITSRILCQTKRT